jgi:hypothetical protein
MTAQKALTTASSVQCGHGGTVGIASDAKLKVGGKPVLRRSSIQGKDITACITPDSNTATKCRKVALVTGGEASKLQVGGQAVVLETLTGSTNGLPAVPPGPGQPLGPVQAVQTKLLTT